MPSDALDVLQPELRALSISLHVLGPVGFGAEIERSVPLNAVERAEAALCVAKDLKRLWQQGNWYVAAWGPS